MVASPLVETKLLLPQPRGDAVARPRLTELLDQGARAQAHPGLRPSRLRQDDAARQGPHPADRPAAAVAWVSLEEDDSQPARFWTYLVTALQRALPEVGDGALALLATGQPSLDECRGHPHQRAGRPGDRAGPRPGRLPPRRQPRPATTGVAFLLEHLPPHVHLLISTRADPALPLARLRARGELVEIRAADLRFTPDEAAAYLNEVDGLELTAQRRRRAGGAHRRVDRRAPAGGALDAGAGRRPRRSSPASPATTATSSTTWSRRSCSASPSRSATSCCRPPILDRLSGPLCDAVTGQDGGKAMLEALERANLFLVPLDDRRRWYRYHHLFADVLQAHLLDEQRRRRARPAPPGQRVVRRRTANRPRPIRHALAAGDFERAADLVELAVPALQRDRQEATMVSWLALFPDDVVAGRPVLGVGFIGALMSNGQFAGVAERLRDPNSGFPDHGPTVNRANRRPGTTVADRGVEPHTGSTRAVPLRARSLIGGNTAETVTHAERAHLRAAEDDHLTRAGAAAPPGSPRWADGDLEAAHRAYSAASKGSQRAGHISDVLGCCDHPGRHPASPKAGSPTLCAPTRRRYASQPTSRAR